MSNTPRTDAEIQESLKESDLTAFCNMVDFARTLERELIEAKEAIEDAESHNRYTNEEAIKAAQRIAEYRGENPKVYWASWYDRIPIMECLRDLTAARARIVELEAKIESANEAFGFHGDSDTNLAAEITQLRDECRGHFHTVTALTQDKARYAADAARLDWLERAKCAYFHEGPFCWRVNDDSDTDGETLRDSIDKAAMKGTK